MNRTLCYLLSLLFGCVSIGESQLIRTFGLKIGVASTNQTWDWTTQSGIVANSTAQQGFDAGVYAEWLDMPLLSISTEIHYIQKGSDVKTNIMVTTEDHPDGTGQFYRYSTRVSYLSIPVLAKLRLTWGSLTPFLLLGPRFDFYLSGNGPFSSRETNKDTFGGTIGGGVEIVSILPLRIGGEFRYSPTFQNSYSVQSVTTKNSSVEFLLVLSY
jgi:hypothetical protein